MSSMKNYRNNETLCWSCRNASKGELSPCAWASSFQPVEGWKAIDTTVYGQTNIHGRNERRDLKSYRVLKCPLFKRG